MIADRRNVLVIDVVVIRCDECPRQVTIYESSTHPLELGLEMLGWTSTPSYLTGEMKVTHLCTEHSQ